MALRESVSESRRIVPLDSIREDSSEILRPISLVQLADTEVPRDAVSAVESIEPQ